jgi:outer membrane protein TolC
MNRIRHSLFVGMVALLLSHLAFGQAADTPPPSLLSLDQCVEYALQNSPIIKTSQINEEIGDRQIKSSLSGWLPQVSATFNAAHNIKLQTTAFGDQLITLGQNYNSNLLFQVNQTLFNRDQLFASKAADVVRNQLDQSSLSGKISTVVAVSKAYYDILLTYEQVKILNENLDRLNKQFKDAKSRYESGIVDKTDYQRASISLSNVRSDKNRVEGSIKAKKSYLKQLMGFPTEDALDLDFNYQSMEKEITMDTTVQLQIENRIEYKLLQSQLSFSNLQTRYEKWSFIPKVSAYYNYNLLFFNNTASDLYRKNYPTSAVGLSFGIPIFEGGKRTQQIKLAELSEEKTQIEMSNLKRSINTQYESAMADYKSNLFEWESVKQNMDMAEEVYGIIKLQYDEGIKAYVDLIIAETELRTAQLNHYNALYKVLASKLDLDQALGNIEINQTSK